VDDRWAGLARELVDDFDDVDRGFDVFFFCVVAMATERLPPTTDSAGDAPSLRFRW